MGWMDGLCLYYTGFFWCLVVIDCYCYYLLLVLDSQAASASSDPLLNSIFPESELQSKKRPPTVSLF